MKHTKMYTMIPRILGAMTGWILVPAIVGGFLGTRLDEKYDTAPWLFLLILGLSFIISVVGIARVAMKEFRRLDGEQKGSADDIL